MMKLEIRNLSAGYAKDFPVLKNVSLSVEEGSIVSVIGPNGCGKSTLLKVIVQLLKPGSGMMLLDGVPMQKITPAERAKKLAVLFQKQPLPGELSAEEFISFGRYPNRRFCSASKEADRQAVEKAIALTGTDHLRKRILTQLSGGELQKVRIAMTLAQEPELLILDEPTTYLDVRSRIEVMELVRQLNLEEHITVLMVLHDLDSACAYSEKTAMMKDGRIECFGSPESVMTKENLRTVFDINAEMLNLDGKSVALVRGL